MNERLTLLLIENDPSSCKNVISEIAENAENFTLVGVTNNPNRAMQYIYDTRPDVIILGLSGKEDGDICEFLKKLKTADIARPPYILVLAEDEAAAGTRAVKECEADFIMLKNRDGNPAKEALNFLKITAPVIASRKPKDGYGEAAPADEMNERRIQRRISNELDKLGISSKSIGYRYLIDAIAIIMKQSVQHVCNVVSKKYGKTGNSVERAMQNAINRAWASTDEEELKANYTAKIKSSKGIPTITEFIFYYAKKLNNEF